MAADATPVVHPHDEYFAFLEKGQFMIQHSPSCGQYVFYPRVAAPGSGATDLQWVPASGNGTVYATTVMRPRPPAGPYNVALVELAEGPRMMTRVEGLPAEQIVIGMTVRARIASEDGAPLVVFDVIDSGDSA
jgi:uncharacterized OB-fold protein